MKTIEIERSITVHKAALPVGAKESLGDFTQALHMAVQGYVSKKLNAKTYDCWPREVFGDNVIMSCYASGSDGTPGTTKLYQVDYTRSKDGSFTFSDMVEVKAKTTYEPVVGVFGIGSTPVSKQTENVDPVAKDTTAPGTGKPLRNTRPAPARAE